jgi:hypothetical protein
MPHSTQQGAADSSVEPQTHLVLFCYEMLCSRAGTANPKKLVAERWLASYEHARVLAFREWMLGEAGQSR